MHLCDVRRLAPVPDPPTPATTSSLRDLLSFSEALESLPGMAGVDQVIAGRGVHAGLPADDVRN